MNEHKHYNALARIAEGHYDRLKQWKETYGTWTKAWQHEWQAAVNPNNEWEKLEKANVELVLFNDDRYPTLLREIPAPPFGLYVKGTLPAHNDLCVAIVGTRKATPQGLALSREFGATLARNKTTVISGLALGVDAAAHTGVVEQKGRTFAVLAVGLDTVYPKQHRTLAKHILDNGGGLISEYTLGMPALPHQFIERNRIISGLSRGVVVIEAPKRSGSLATATFATEHNRDIFVTPGPAKHPNYAGSHDLIRTGATLVTDPLHILEEYDVAPAQNGQQTIAFTDHAQGTIYTMIYNEGKPVEIDTIAQVCNLSTLEVTRSLTLLIMRGVIKESGGKYFI